MSTDIQHSTANNTNNKHTSTSASDWNTQLNAPSPPDLNHQQTELASGGVVGDGRSSSSTAAADPSASQYIPVTISGAGGAQPPNGLRNTSQTQQSSHGYTILVPANVRFQGMNMQLDLKLDQHALAVAESLSKAVRSKTATNTTTDTDSPNYYTYVNGNAATPTSQLDASSSSAPSTSRDYSGASSVMSPSSTSSMMDTSCDGGGGAAMMDDPPLPLSTNMRRKTGGRNPRDLLAEKLKKAAHRHRQMSNGDLVAVTDAALTNGPPSQQPATTHHECAPPLSTATASVTSSAHVHVHHHQQTTADGGASDSSVVGTTISLIGATGSGGLVTLSHCDHDQPEIHESNNNNNNQLAAQSRPQTDSIVNGGQTAATLQNGTSTMTRGSPAMLAVVNGSLTPQPASTSVHHHHPNMLHASSPSASTTASAAALPHATASGSEQKKPRSGSRNRGETGQQCEYNDPEKPCRQRAIGGYRFCIRHILNDPSAPYRACEHKKKMKKKSDKEVNCSNPVRLDQELPYCSTHLILLGIKEPKRKGNNKALDSSDAQSTSSAGAVAVGPPSSADLPSDLLNLETSGVGVGDMSMGDAALLNGFDALPSPTGSNGRHMQPSTSMNWQSANGYYNNNNNGAPINGGVSGTSPLYTPQSSQYTQLSRMAPPHNANNQLCVPQPPTPSSANTDASSLNPVAILNSLQSPLPSPSFSGMTNGAMSNSQQFTSSSTSSYGAAASAGGGMAPNGALGSSSQQSSSADNIIWQSPAMVNAASPGSFIDHHHQQQQPPPQYFDSRNITSASTQHFEQPGSMPGGVYGGGRSSSVTSACSSRPDSRTTTFQMTTTGTNSGYTHLMAPHQTTTTTHQLLTNDGASATGNNNWLQQSSARNTPQSAPPHMTAPGGSNASSELVQSYPELAAKLSGACLSQSQPGSTSLTPTRQQQQQQDTFTRPHSHTTTTTTTLTPLQPLGHRQSSMVGSSLDDELSSGVHDGPFLRPESSTSVMLTSTPGGSVTSTPIKHQQQQQHSVAQSTLPSMSTLWQQPAPAPTHIQQQQQRQPQMVQHPLPTTTSQTAMQSQVSNNSNQPAPSAVSVTQQPQPQQQPRLSFPYYAAALIARLQQRRHSTTGAAHSTGTGVVESVYMNGKKVIRLRQKQQHLRMIGKYRHIPGVQQMCKMLEEGDFDRSDLFPLGLEPSDSDTDSEEDDNGVGSREVERCFASRLLDSSPEPCQDRHSAEDGGDSNGLLRTKLYLLKKQLRLERHRLLREARSNAFIMPTARKYPNAVGQALVDRQSRVSVGMPAHSQSRLKWKLLKRAVHAHGDNPHYKGDQPDAKRTGRRGVTGGRSSCPSRTSARNRVRLNDQRACVHAGCAAARLPYSNHCSTHVLHNVDQSLFRYCAHSQCSRPVLDISGSGAQPTMCRLHQPHITTTTIVGNGVSPASSSSASPHKRYPSQKPKKRRRPQTQRQRQQAAANNVDAQVHGGMHMDTSDTLDQDVIDSGVSHADISIANVLNRSAQGQDMDVTLASVAKDFGFEDDQELTELLNHIQPDDTFTSIIGSSDFGASTSGGQQQMLTSVGGGNRTMTVMGGGNNTNNTTSTTIVPDSSTAVTGLPPAVTLSQQGQQHRLTDVSSSFLLPPPTSGAMMMVEASGMVPSLPPPHIDMGGHSWADIEQFLLSEGYRSTSFEQQPIAPPTNTNVEPPPAYSTSNSSSAQPPVHWVTPTSS